MPKVSRVGKLRKTAAAVVAETKAAANESNDIVSISMSRGQRKRQAKKDQYLKRQAMVSSCLSLKKEEDQRKRIDGLDALKEALMTTISKDEKLERPAEKLTKKSNHLTSNESKRKLTVQEVSHLGLVLEHPEFQSNPFAAIQQHLKNTLAPQAKQLKKESAIRTKELAAEAVQRKKAKKEKIQERGGKHRKKFHAARRGRI